MKNILLKLTLSILKGWETEAMKKKTSYKFLFLYHQIEISNFFIFLQNRNCTSLYQKNYLFNILLKLKFWLALLKKINFFLSFPKTKIPEQLRKKFAILSRNKNFSKLLKRLLKMFLYWIKTTVSKIIYLKKESLKADSYVNMKNVLPTIASQKISVTF